MAQQKITRSKWSGGINTIGERVGKENNYAFSQGLNIFESPDYVIPARVLTKVSGSTVDGQVYWGADGSPFDTNRYFLDQQGKIYRETSAGTWSTLRTVTGCAGEGLLVFDNYLYYLQDTDIGRYGPLDGTPSFTDSFSNWWIASQLQTTGGGTGATVYTLPTTISETATNRQTFNADHDPLKTVTMNIAAKGTGDWTITIHDSADNFIWSSTYTNANVNTGDFVFEFSKPLRLKVDESYHIHLTSTVADGTVNTDTNNDLEGATFTVDYYPLVSAEFHQTVEFLNGFAFLNEHYIGYFDLATYEPNKIELAPGFEARTVAKIDEFIVVGAWRGQSFAEAEEARLYFWDGIQPTFNYFSDVKIGAVNALGNFRNNLVGVYGNKGSIQSGNTPFQELVNKIPGIARGKNIEVLPGAIDTFDNKLVIGIAGSTDDGSSLQQGVYEYGSQEDDLPEALNYPFVVSTETTQSTSLKISLVKTFGEDMYVGWRDDTSYGVDKVTAGDNASISGSFEDLIFDNGDPDKQHQAIKVEITFDPLTTGQSVTPKYQLDRSGSFTTGDTVSTTGATKAVVYINARCNESQWGFNWASSSGTFLKIKTMSFIYSDLSEEGDSA